ncbi:MAG: Uncharacterized protein G01um101438_342 [Parcubacteria group bacterium Gr01-1014_38]|nr:MAG: Uncharacterized protein G01um101438_342 [Parcubacteria group bacterium Gr01-1014_38]
MLERRIVEDQLAFYRQGNAGCLFAAHAASDPEKFGWYFSVADVDPQQMESLIQEAISDEKISTKSIIFPKVLKRDDLKELLLAFKKVNSIFLGSAEECEDSICLGYRVRVGEEVSWMLGFGGFDFLPKTRQALFTEITFRCKPKPEYRQVMKESDPGVLHVAHMDMQGMREAKFKSLWYGSIDHAEEILGRPSDLRSKAKTTFAVPADLFKELEITAL